MLRQHTKVRNWFSRPKIDLSKTSNMTEVASSSLALLINFILWNDKIGLEECPYMRRWVLFPRWYSLRLHFWLSSDDIRARHDHEWWFITLILWGKYKDYSENEVDILSTGSIRFRRANYKHTVQIERPTLTLLITGRPLQRFNFYINGKRVKRDKYFAVYGHHPCDNVGEPIRFRPDRTRI